MLKHDCKDGDNCYMARHVVDFDNFNDAMPGNVGFSDIDQFCEYRGHYFIAEWKTPDVGINRSQELALERLSRDLNTGRSVFMYITGNAGTGHVIGYKRCVAGNWQDWVNCSTDQFLEMLEKWGKGILEAEHRQF